MTKLQTAGLIITLLHLLWLLTNFSQHYLPSSPCLCSHRRVVGIHHRRAESLVLLGALSVACSEGEATFSDSLAKLNQHDKISDSRPLNIYTFTLHPESLRAQPA